MRNAFKGHTNWINSLDFSPNSPLLVSASDDETIRIWNIRDGAAQVLKEDNPSFLGYTSAVFSPDGRFIAASHFDSMVRIWDRRTGNLLRKVKADINWVFDVAFMPNGKGLVSGSRELKYFDDMSLYADRLASSQAIGDSQREEGEVLQISREYTGHEVRWLFPLIFLATVFINFAGLCFLNCHLA